MKMFKSPFFPVGSLLLVACSLAPRPVSGSETRLLASASSGSGNTKTMIGRCSYDNQSSADGQFRVGNAVANFYRVTDGSNSKVVVAHGIAFVPGSVSNKTEKITVGNGDVKEIDQGSLWPSYEVTMSPDSVALSFAGYWIDGVAREISPDQPTRSNFGYSVRKLGRIDSRAVTDASFLQNKILGQPNAYPTCVFWESPAL